MSTIKCPKCGNTHLQICIAQWADVQFDEDGVHEVTDGPSGDLEWDDDSTVICTLNLGGCGWCGVVKELGANDKPTHVQIAPTVREGDDVRMAEEYEEPGYWSVYLGRPGAFEWQADFREFIVADCFALKLCADHGADLIRGRA